MPYVKAKTLDPGAGRDPVSFVVPMMDLTLKNAVLLSYHL